MWELNYKESWASKNLCFWTVMLKKRLESHLDCKEIQPVHPKGSQSWIFIGRTDAKTEIPILWSLMRRTDSWKRPWCWKKLKAGGEGEDRWWHHQLNGYEFEQALRVDVGQRSLAYCSPWGHKELDMTERLNWTELTWGKLSGFSFLFLWFCCGH